MSRNSPSWSASDPDRPCGQAMENSRVHSGEQEALSILIHNEAYRIEGLSNDQQSALVEHFQGFCACGPSRYAQAAICNVKPVISPVHSQVVFVNNEYRIGIHHESSRVVMHGHQFKAVIQKGGVLHVELHVSEQADTGVVVSAIDNVVRTLVAYRLYLTDGLLLHSAAILADGEALVFFGRSGAGKSTISQAAHEAGHQVLSDDLNAIVRQGDRYWVRQLPLTGDFGRAGTIHSAPIPLSGLYRLDRDLSPGGVHPMSRAHAAAALIACAPYVNVDPACRSTLLDFAVALTQAHPAAMFHFVRDNPFKDQLKVLSPARQCP
jgi:hypothetical protein